MAYYEMHDKLKKLWRDLLASSKENEQTQAMGRLVAGYLQEHPERAGMIQGPDGPVHWLQVGLETFTKKSWDTKLFFAALPAGALDTSNEHVAAYLSQADAQYSSFVRQLVKQEFNRTGECPLLVPLLKVTDPEANLAYALSWTFQDNPIKGVEIAIANGFEPQLLRPTLKRLFGQGVDAKDCSVSLFIELCNNCTQGNVAQGFFQAMLQHVQRMDEVHGRCDGREFTLREMVPKVEAYSRAIYFSKAKPLPDIAASIQSRQNAKMAQQALADILDLRKINP